MGGGGVPVGVVASLYLILQDASGNPIRDPALYASVTVSGEVTAVAEELPSIPLTFQYSSPYRWAVFFLVFLGSW